MSDTEVVGICPTIYGIPQFENLRRIQAASFDPVLSSLYYAGEPWQGWMEQWTTQDKIVHLFKTAYETHPDAWVLLLHHDVVLEDPDLFMDLVFHIKEEQFSISGPRENDGVMRNSYYGKHYCHSAFLLCNPARLGHWWEVDKWIENGWIEDGQEFRLRGMDRYWKISHDCFGNIHYLGSRWREPRIGKSTFITFNDKPVATHLWLSAGDIRVHKNWQTIEGDDPVEVARWRREFCEHYAGRFGVPLVECPEDTIRGLDHYRKGWSTDISNGQRREFSEIAQDALRKRL